MAKTRTIHNVSSLQGFHTRKQTRKQDSCSPCCYPPRTQNKSSNMTAMQLIHRSFQFILLSLIFMLNGSAAEEEISYVIEPFELISDQWFSRLYNDGGALNLSLTETGDGLFGNHALQINYQVNQTETWGGFVDFGWILDMTEPPHNCDGASHLSLWYKILQPQSQSGRVHLRLIMLDDSDCIGDDCANPPGQSLENYYTFHYVLDDDGDSGWKELRVELRGDDDSGSPFWRTGWTGQVGNNVLDADHLRGWRIELSIDDQGDIGDTSEGVILVDHLSCVGDGDLLGAAFRTGDTFDESISKGIWHERYYQSMLSRNMSEADLLDGSFLDLNYTIEQAETWGGFVDYQHLAPGAGYYNLSEATDVRFMYRVLEPSSSFERAHLRLILMDGSDCLFNCSDYPGQNLENYYSFLYILDQDMSGDSEFASMTIALEGDSDSSSPFWRTGWTGVVGNDVLDRSYIKGYRFELNVDSQGDVGDLVSGVVEIGSPSAVVKVSQEEEEILAEQEISYVIEPFELISDQWFSRLYNDGGALNLSLTETGDGLFGNHALQINYQVNQTETWGGFVDFGWILDMTEPPHNCDGASHLSLWYKILQPQSQSGRVHLRLIMLDDSDCIGDDCANPPGQSLENYYTFHYVLDDDGDSGWKELRVELRGDDDSGSPFWRTGWTGQVGNNVLDADHLRGWRIELSIDDQGDIGDTSEGVILVDHLSCVGDGDLLGAAFRTGDTFDESISKGIWHERYYQSMLSRNMSEADLLDGSFLDLNYTIEQAETWGGFVDYQHLAPGAGYYNLSEATDVRFMYRVLEPSSSFERAHLRLILMDGSDCLFNCSDYPGQNLENYYSFLYILDQDMSGDSEFASMTIALEGDSDSSSPFWRTGWTGVVGNDVLDRSYIKGYRFELNVDSQGDVGDLVSGVVEIGSPSAVVKVSQEEEEILAEQEISYVIEPFELIPDQWFSRLYNDGGALNLSLTETGDGLFGNHALQINYQVNQTETWGGFVDFGWILDMTEPPHNCDGASHLSLWYKILQPQSQSGRVHLRLIMLDDSDCIGDDCANPPGQSLENYYTFHYVLDDDGDSGWKELRVELRGDDDSGSPFWRTGWTGQVGNNVLDADHLRGWRIELSIDDQGDIGDTSEGVILVDHLSCVGDGDLLGAAFRTGDTFDESISKGIWHERYYQSMLSRNMSEADLLDGSFLDLNYTIEQAETWGGFVDYQHLAPGAGYYNLSEATDVRFMYRVLEPSSSFERAHLRLILMDGSDCLFNCSDYPGQNLENYYSFLYILDQDMSGDSEFASMTIALEGDSDSSSPFWRTGWTGVVGNDVLDRSYIKGYRFELNVDSQGDVGDLVSGVLQIGSPSVIARVPEEEDSEDPETNIFDTLSCVSESDLLFDVFDEFSDFERKSFLGSRCCEECMENPNCQYALATEQDCYMASDVAPESIALLNTDYLQSEVTAFWKDSSIRRGDFCTQCTCSESERLIDCRGQDLALIPKMFSFRQLWTPQILDLRNNPRLAVLGTDALAAISDSLEELILPRNMRHIALGSINNLTSLKVVHFEEDPALDQKNADLEVKSTVALTATRSVSHKLKNAIARSSDFFGDVCCSRGHHIDLQWPPGGLTFCDMVVDTPGVDAIYEEFIEYFGAETIVSLQPTSNFMAEAAESAEKCAEYCAIRDGCMYFSYDARWKESEHTCRLLTSNGTSSRVCCKPDSFADTGGTLPGWTSGRPPRTRYDQDNARVLSTPQDLVADETNNYHAEYSLTLGATPLRGAVWVEPSLVSTTNLDVSITPERVVLYDNITTVNISVKVSNIDMISSGETIVLTNKIKSCDKAFTATSACSAESTVYIDVTVPRSSNFVLPITLASLALAALVALILMYREHKKRQADMMWSVALSELTFDDPPEIIGRGTFGLVLLAEYRGTQVAVKRVIPPRVSKNSSLVKVGLFGSGDRMSSVGTLGSMRSMTSAFDDSAHPEEVTDDVELGTIVATEKLKDNPGINSGSNFGSMSSVQEGTNSWRKKIRNYRYGDTYSRLKADFVREMRYLSKLRHPCITTVMGAVISQKEEPMLVMEYMDHGSLYDLLNNETMVIEGEHILPILRDIAQGLRFLHAADPQVIHGDLKAQNILVDNKFRAKVADFGLSQKKQLGATGTPFWMAPELLRGESVNTAASDVYSFGIILYEVYSRKEPYAGEDFKEVLSLITDPAVNKRPPVPAACPTEIQSLMKSCLLSSPEKRPSFEHLDLRLKQLDVINVEPGKMSHSMHIKKDAMNHASDKLLSEVFPKHIAEALRDGRKVEPESREVVTIYFSDIVGFTDISSTLPPLKISQMLDRLYNKFDNLSHKHGVFKVETIGDAYMAVTNLSEDQADHTKRIAEFAIDTVRAANDTLVDEDDLSKGYVNIRVGFHSGPVVANVVGSRSPRYCLFGDTVNTASRMESNSKENRIHCSERAADLLKDQLPGMNLVSRGKIHVKGKGEMRTYWVNELSRSSHRSYRSINRNSIRRLSAVSSESATSPPTSNHLRQPSTEKEEQNDLSSSFHEG